MNKKLIKFDIQMSEQEIKYLKELVESESFQLRGLENIKYSSDIKEELKIIENLKNTFNRAAPQVA